MHLLKPIEYNNMIDIDVLMEEIDDFDIQIEKR